MTAIPTHLYFFDSGKYNILSQNKFFYFVLFLRYWQYLSFIQSFISLDSIIQVSALLFLATWVINEVAGWWLRGPSYLTFPTNIPQLYPLPPSWGQDLQKTPTKCGQWKSCGKLSIYKQPWYTLNTLEIMSCPSICMSLRNLLFNGHIYGYIAVGGGY